MKNYIIILSLFALVFSSCSKEEGEGGRSSISGKIHMTDNTGGIQGDYDIPDYDVYIIYGEEDNVYDDDMKTNYDGTFKFANLREGTYRVYAYTTDAAAEAGVTPVFKSISIGGDEEGKVGTIEVEK